MSMSVAKVIEDAKGLSVDERAFLARCLISSLETEHEEEVDIEWADVAQKRFLAMKNEEAHSVSWDEIKDKIRK